MTAIIRGSDTERFRSVISHRLGLQYDESKLGYLGEVLARRSEESGVSASAYLDRLESQDPWHGEIGTLAQELTVPETYFFRHSDQLRAFTEKAVPDRLRACAGTRKLSIFSAGCASGEEPYSLAILLREKVPEASSEVAIRAVDVNPVPLEKARLGRYSAWALRETPPDVQRRWFQQEGREFLLDPSIRSAVRFEERNLVAADPDLWRAGTYDIVFFRNVMMYFTPKHAQSIVLRITRALAPGGYLFLGHAETLRGLSHDYCLRHTHESFYYQRKDTIDLAPGELASPEASLPDGGNPVVDSSWAVTWIETVRRSSERIEGLVDTKPHLIEGGASPAAVAAPRPELRTVLNLLEQERFTEALESLRGLSPQLARDPDALLLRAVLLTHGGQLENAAEACKELLAIDDLNAGAQYLLALCREGMGDTQGAVDHGQAATYIDPSFAMPRLHLGFLARRAGDRETACRELGQALTLLQREEASRLLLFGGGFSRDALVALCKTELLAAGGKL